MGFHPNPPRTLRPYPLPRIITGAIHAGTAGIRVRGSCFLVEAPAVCQQDRRWEGAGNGPPALGLAMVWHGLSLMLRNFYGVRVLRGTMVPAQPPSRFPKHIESDISVELGSCPQTKKPQNMKSAESGDWLFSIAWAQRQRQGILYL